MTPRASTPIAALGLRRTSAAQPTQRVRSRSPRRPTPAARIQAPNLDGPTEPGDAESAPAPGGAARSTPIQTQLIVWDHVPAPARRPLRIILAAAALGLLLGIALGLATGGRPLG